jgi:hypothetical protein
VDDRPIRDEQATSSGYFGSLESWKAFHKQFCITPEERAPASLEPATSSPRRKANRLA